MTGVDRKLSARLLVESLVIVVSILAAFALDRWWESVRARAEEQQVLESLDAEFRAARSQLESTLALHQRTLHSVAFVRGELDKAVRDGATLCGASGNCARVALHTPDDTADARDA